MSDATSSRINSLVEYPLTTVVLVIKPPGSGLEFEVKRAGRKGSNPLSVVFRRTRNRVPPSHRLDASSMQWLLRYEARSAAKLSAVYRLVHGTEAPLRVTFRAPRPEVPSRLRPVSLVIHDPGSLARVCQMRAAMKTWWRVRKMRRELRWWRRFGLTAEFRSVAPAQALLSGTVSFRLDKIGGIFQQGAERYFSNYCEFITLR